MESLSTWPQRDRSTFTDLLGCGVELNDENNDDDDDDYDDDDHKDLTRW